MEQPPHKINGISLEWPSGLKSLDVAARELGMSSERLRGLCDGGYAPHIRVDGGDPQFKISELKRWAANNLLQQMAGRDLPEPVRIVVSPKVIADFRQVPAGLRGRITLPPSTR